MLKKSALFIAIVAAVSLAGCNQKINEKDLLKKMQDSGEFDTAVEASIDRIMKKKQGDQQKARQAQMEKAKESAKNVTKPNSSDYIFGNKDATYSIVEFSDYECPYCKRFYATPKQIVAKNPDVNLVWRHFPLPMHNPMAMDEAVAVECAGKLGGNAAFWKYSDKVIETTATNGKGMPGTDAIVTTAKSIGLDTGKFKACLTDKAIADKVNAQMQNGAAAGIQGTPGVIVVNNKTGAITALPGAVPAEMIEQAIAGLK